MFNSIRGILTLRRLDTIRIETGGIEWECTVPAVDAERFPSPGETARVYLWLYHREDQMRLFGFFDEKRRETFLELQKVEGIGPRQAVKIMSGISQEELERALEAGDVGRLEAVPGLGKKTAQKMILALKGKIAVNETGSGVPMAHHELVEALVGMGFDRKAGAEAVAKAEAELDGEEAARSAKPEERLSSADREKQLFKRAIMLLSSSV